MSEQFVYGSVTFTLDNLSESDEYLRSVIDQHKALPGLDFCEVCGTRTPCDVVSLAASGLARSRDLAVARAWAEELRVAFIRHRTSTHETVSKACLTCQESDAILAVGPEQRANELGRVTPS